MESILTSIIAFLGLVIAALLSSRQGGRQHRNLQLALRAAELLELVKDDEATRETLKTVIRDQVKTLRRARTLDSVLMIVIVGSMVVSLGAWNTLYFEGPELIPQAAAQLIYKIMPWIILPAIAFYIIRAVREG